MSRGYGSKGGLAGVARSMLGVNIDHGAGDIGTRRFYLEGVKSSYSAIPAKLAYQIVSLAVDGVDDADEPVYVNTSRIDWLRDVEIVPASVAKRRERHGAQHEETVIAIQAIGDGFPGSKLDLERALEAAGIKQSRVGGVISRVAVAERQGGARNRHIWRVRVPDASGVQASASRALELDGLDDLGPMVASADADVRAGV